MATPTSGASPAQPGGSGTSIPVRPLTAWALLALAAAIVLFNFLAWIFPPSSATTFVDRVFVSDFTGLTVLVAPLLAMLIATRLGPTLSRAKLMGLIALGTYAAALLFGVLSFLLNLADKFDVAGRGGFYGFGAILQGLGGIIIELLSLGLLALAALWTYKIFVGLGGRLPAVDVRTD